VDKTRSKIHLAELKKMMEEGEDINGTSMISSMNTEEA